MLAQITQLQRSSSFGFLERKFVQETPFWKTPSMVERSTPKRILLMILLCLCLTVHVQAVSPCAPGQRWNVANNRCQIQCNLLGYSSGSTGSLASGSTVDCECNPGYRWSGMNNSCTSTFQFYYFKYLMYDTGKYSRQVSLDTGDEILIAIDYPSSTNSNGSVPEYEATLTTPNGTIIKTPVGTPPQTATHIATETGSYTLDYDAKNFDHNYQVEIGYSINQGSWTIDKANRVSGGDVQFQVTVPQSTNINIYFMKYSGCGLTSLNLFDTTTGLIFKNIRYASSSSYISPEVVAFDRIQTVDYNEPGACKIIFMYYAICSSIPNAQSGNTGISCLCDATFGWNPVTFTCDICSSVDKSLGSSSVSSNNMQTNCDCETAYVWNIDNFKCEFDCAVVTNSNGTLVSGSATVCHCNNGYTWNSTASDCQQEILLNSQQNSQMQLSSIIAITVGAVVLVASNYLFIQLLYL